MSDSVYPLTQFQGQCVHISVTYMLPLMYNVYDVTVMSIGINKKKEKDTLNYFLFTFFDNSK